MLKGIKNIIFDIGGVLIDLDFERCIESFRKIGFEEADKYVSCYHPSDFFGALERGEITGEEFCSRVRDLIGNSELSDSDICEAYISLLCSIPIEKLRLMKSLRDRGYKLYALSNMSRVMLPKVLEFFEADGLTAEDYFCEMFISAEMGVMKPSPEIYNMVISKTGIEPRETLFIDDGIKNVDMALELGMQVYHAAAREDYSHLFEYQD